MKVKTLIIALVGIPLLNFAMGQKHDTTHPSKQTIEAAQSSGKLILVISEPVDGMATAILNNRHTSRFLDTHFVIEQQLNPNGQGAYLIYNQQQELLHRIVHEPYPYEMAVKIKRALDPDSQYYTLLAQFENGDRSAALLENLISGASDAGDRENAGRLMQAFLDTQESPLSPENIRFLAKYTKRSNEPGFALLLANTAVADDVLGAGRTAEKLANIIFGETFAPHLNEKNIDLEALITQTKSAYPNKSLAFLIDGMAIQLLEMREDWEGLESALPVYLSTYGDQLSEAMRNYYAWLSSEYLKNS